MKVRLKCTFAGPTVFWPDGTVLDLSDSEAESLIRAGYAEEVAEDDAPESVAPVEDSTDKRVQKAEKRPGRSKRR